MFALFCRHKSHDFLFVEKNLGKTMRQTNPLSKMAGQTNTLPMAGKAIRTVDVHLKFSSLKIEDVRQTPHSRQKPTARRQQPTHIYRLNSAAPFVNPRELFAAIFNDWPELVRCISIILRCYTIFALYSLAVIHFNYDRLRYRIRSAMSESKLGPKCANWTLDATTTSELDLIEDWIRNFGSIFKTFNGVASAISVLGASVSVCFDFIGPIVIYFKRPRFDTYGFIKDKHAERRRFSSKMRVLVDDLFVRNEKVCPTNKERVLEYTAKADHSIARAYSKALGSISNRFSVNKLKRPIELNTDVLLIVGDRELHQLIEPAHLTDWWHRRLCAGSRRLSQLGFLIIIGFGFFVLAPIVTIELVRRLSYRLNFLSCLKEGKFLSPQHFIPLRLGGLEGPAAEFFAHSDLDGSLMNYGRLILAEIRLDYGWIELFNLSGLVHLMACSSFTCSLYIGLYMAQYGSKTLWLNQIRQQVRGCIDSLISAPRSTNEHRTRRADSPENTNIKMLTLAYLNFELFRREQKAYQSLINFLVFQMILMNLPVVVITYLSLAVLHENDRIIMFIFVGYTFSFLNSYLITSAIRTNMVLKLMKDMSRLLAYMTKDHLEQTMVARLWSMQVLNYGEALSCFAPKLFGISISFDKIVSLNVYMVALWILSLKA